MEVFIILRDINSQEREEIETKPNSKVWVSPEVNTAQFSFSFERIGIDNDWMQLASDIIKNLPHRVYEGKKVVEHLEYDKSFLFFHTRFILFSRFYLAHQEATIVSELIKDEAAGNTITVFASSPYLKQFEFDKNVNVHLQGKGLGTIPKFRFFALTAIRTLVGLFQVGKRKRAKHIFLNPPVKLVPILDKQTLKLKPGNPPVEYYVDDFLQKDDAYILDELYPLRELDYSLSKKNIFGLFKGKTIFLEPYLLRALLDSKTRKDRKAFLQKERRFLSLAQQNEKNPYYKLANTINHDLMQLRALAIVRMKAADLFFIPTMKSFGSIDEHSVRVKSLSETARRKGLKIYALQHGLLHKYHHSYIYLAEDHNYLQIPDTTFVFGTQAKSILLDYGHFPENQISVSGQLRTDIIPKLKSANVDLSYLGLDNDKPIVLYASQPEAASLENELRDLLNADFFRLRIDFPEYQFVLKPHPREVDHSYFHGIAQKVGTKDYKIITEDLYLLLSQCSVLLVNSSSVGAEAIFFDKPLVVMDYSKVDVLGYISSGVAFKATNHKEAQEVLNNILKKGERIEPTILENYRQKYTGTIDGKVSERILNVVVN